MHGVNLTVDLFQNMMVPEFYQTCIKSIQICDCSSSKAGCYSNCNYYHYGDGEDNQHIAHRKLDHNGITTLRITYFSKDPKKEEGFIRENIFLNIIPEHCDKLFTEARTKNGDDEKHTSSLNVVLIVVGGTILVLILVGLATFYKVK